MGCQKEIARKILDREADYLLAVKGNQGQLYQDTSCTKTLETCSKRGTGVNDLPHDYATTLNKGHGRMSDGSAGPSATLLLAEGLPGVPEH